MRRFLFLISPVLIFFCSCGAPHENGSISFRDSARAIQRVQLGPLDSAVIYCWCFKDGKSYCTSVIRVEPEDLCDTSHRYAVINQFDHLAHLREFINKSKTQPNRYGHLPDSRFVIKVYDKDTSYLLTYFDDTTLMVDAQRELICPRPVLAWIMVEMGWSEINCE